MDKQMKESKSVRDSFVDLLVEWKKRNETNAPIDIDEIAHELVWEVNPSSYMTILKNGALLLDPPNTSKTKVMGIAVEQNINLPEGLLRLSRFVQAEL